VCRFILAEPPPVPVGTSADSTPSESSSDVGGSGPHLSVLCLCDVVPGAGSSHVLGWLALPGGAFGNQVLLCTVSVTGHDVSLIWSHMPFPIIINRRRWNLCICTVLVSKGAV